MVVFIAQNKAILNQEVFLSIRTIILKYFHAFEMSLGRFRLLVANPMPRTKQLSTPKNSATVFSSSLWMARVPSSCLVLLEVRPKSLHD